MACLTSLKVAIDRCIDLSGSSLKKLPTVETLFLDESNFGFEKWERENDVVPDNTLQSIAAKGLMKVLYGARMCRFELLRATCGLARKITEWEKVCDKQLHRLMAYSTLDLKCIPGSETTLKPCVLIYIAMWSLRETILPCEILLEFI